MNLRGILLLLAAYAFVLGSCFNQSENVDITCVVYVEEEALKCYWNCTENKGPFWKICYSKDSVHWEWKVVEGCSHTITSKNNGIHFNQNMMYTVAVGRNKSDCDFSSYKIINPKEQENILNTVASLRIDEINSTAATLSWRRKTYLKLNIECRCLAVTHNTSFNIEIKKTEDSGDRTGCQLVDLHPYTYYNVTVQCKPATGSVWVTNPHQAVLTNQAAPTSPPRDVKASVQRENVVLTWSPPPQEDKNGVVTKYSLKYHKGDNQFREIEIPGDTRMYEFSDLRCFTEYTFSLTAHTVARSPPSKPTTISTLMCAPLKVNIRSVSVDVKEDGDRIILINATAPSLINGPSPEYITVIQWDGGSLNQTSSNPETSVKLRCPLDERTTPSVVHVSMYAVNYNNGTALVGPLSDFGNQVICSPVTEIKDILPVLVTLPIMAILTCFGVACAVKKKISKSRHLGVPDLQVLSRKEFTATEDASNSQQDENLFLELKMQNNDGVSLSTSGRGTLDENNSFLSSRNSSDFTTDLNELCYKNQKDKGQRGLLDSNLNNDRDVTFEELPTRNRESTNLKWSKDHQTALESGSTNKSFGQVHKTLGSKDTFENSTDDLAKLSKDKDNTYKINTNKDNLTSPHFDANDVNLQMDPFILSLLNANSNEEGSGEYRDTRKTIGQFEDGEEETLPDLPLIQAAIASIAADSSNPHEGGISMLQAALARVDDDVDSDDNENVYQLTEGKVTHLFDGDDEDLSS